jgi:hypothetical protein
MTVRTGTVTLSSSHYLSLFSECLCCSYIPPPPPRAQQAQQRVDYIRGYSEEHGRFFYIKLNHDNDNDNGNTMNPNQGQSQWEAPTEGIVQCRLVLCSLLLCL